MSYTHLLNAFRSSFVAALVIAALVLITFINLEPTVGRAISSNFVVSQQITNEISFIATTSATTMVGSIAGLTGGYATGTNRTVVNTNNPTGYNMTITFPTTTSGRAMQASSTAYIDDYLPVGGAPTSTDYNWIDPSSNSPSRFGFSVAASTTAELATFFRNNGTVCNTTAGGDVADKCWARPSTSVITIINSSGPNSSSTSTIKFKVAVPSNPNPALPATFYYATGTLTALVNP
jgi:hypothetical protein